jgi:hypothetical protein
MLYLCLLIPETGTSKMIDNNMTKNISEAKMIAQQLNDLLHDDAFYRLKLSKEYSSELDPLKWSESVYTRCQLAEALCRKLGSLHS